MIYANNENYLIQLKEEGKLIRTETFLNVRFSKEEIRDVLRFGRYQFKNQKELDLALKEGKFLEETIEFTFEHPGVILCNPISHWGSHWISHHVSSGGLKIRINPNATFEVVKEVV